MNTASRIEVTELLAHARWVEGFARALARDDSEDVAQDSWVAALKYPPRDDHAPRAWFATVMRNAARMQFRGASRRHAREQASIDPHAAAPTPLDSVERMELQRRLADAVLALAEPARTTIVLAFYEGLTAAEIARQMDVPATTVRSRIRAGLEQLRAHLDAEENGDRKRWKQALAPLMMSPERATLASAPWLALALIVVAICAAITTVVVTRRQYAQSQKAAPSSVGAAAAADSTAPGTKGTTSTTSATMAGSPVVRSVAPLPQDDDAPPSTTTYAFNRASSAMVAHIDECYDLATQSGRNPQGMLAMTVEIATRPEVAATIEVDAEKTTIKDPEFLECARENAAAIEEAIERLRANKHAVEGPIRIELTRPMPPPPPQGPSWPADSASPVCTDGAMLKGTVGKEQWCELPDGRAHGEKFIWNKQGHLVYIMSADHGQESNSWRSHDPGDD